MRKIIAWISFCGIFVGASFLGGISFVEATPRLAQVGRAYQFDGVDDYVDFNKTDIDFSGATYVDFEVEMSKQSGEFVSIGQVVDGSNRLEMSWYTNDRIYFVLANGSNTLGHVLVTDFGKHNFRFLFNGSGVTNADRAKVFVDGIEQTLSFSGTIPASLPTLTNDFKFGYSASGYSNGKLGNVRQYDQNRKLLHSWHGDEGVGVRSFDSVKEWLGDELATNGGFDTDTGWSKQAGWSIAGGKAQCDGTQAARVYIVQSVGLKPSTKYRLRFNLTVDSGFFSIGDSGIYLVGSGSSGITQSGEYEFDVKTSSSATVNIYLHGFSNFEGTVDNFSVKELYSPVHGTITNANEATFHTEDRDFVSYQNTIGYAEEVPQEELFDISTTPSVLGGSATTTYSNGIRRITGNNTAVTGSTRTNGVLPHPLELRTYKIAYDARSNTTVKITPDLVDDWPAVGDRPSVTSNFVRYEYEMTAQHTTAGLDFVDWNVQKEGGGNLLATDYGEIRNVSIREVSLPGQLIPRAIDEDGNALLTDIFGNYMDGSRRAAMSDADLYLATPVAVFDGVNDIVETSQESNKMNPGTGDFTVSAVIETVNEGTYHTIAKKQSVYTAGWTFYFHTNGELGIYLGGSGGAYYARSAAGHIPMGGFHEVAAVVKRAATTIIEFYVDGVLKQTVSTATALGTITSDSPVVFASAANGGWQPFKGKMSEFRYYDRALTASEVVNLPDDAQAHYTFSEGGGDTVYDKVPEYYGENIVVNSDFSTDTTWSKGTGWTINGGKAVATAVQSYATINQTAPTNFFKVGSTYRVTINVSTLNSGKFGLYLAGSGTSAQAENDISTSGIHVFIKTLDTVVNQTFAIRGYPNVDGSIKSISIEELYEPAHGTVTNANLSTFWGNDDTSRSDNLLDGFSKGLQSIGTGRMYKPSSVAYGTWEFDFNFRTINDNRFYFISNTPDITVASDGYYIRGVTGGALELRLFINGSSSTVLMKTPDGYIQDNKNYKIRIERASNGAFTCYIKGDTFGEDWLLLNVSGGSGTNPATNNMFTASEYVLATLKGNDTISNLKINASPVDIHTFTNGTGSFQKVNIPAQSGNTGKDVFKNLLAQPTTVNSVVNRLRLSTLNLVTVGRRYWDTSYKKFFLGETSNSFIEFPASNYVVPQTTLNTLNTNKTAVPGRLYYDTTQRVFKKGASDGSIIDY